MAETSIQAARRKAREKREAAERAAAEKAAADSAAKSTDDKEEEKGFFDSFFNRGDAIDDAVEGRKREGQSTDSNN